MFHSPVVSNEPLDGLSWNCSIILSISKWKADLFLEVIRFKMADWLQYVFEIYFWP